VTLIVEDGTGRADADSYASTAQAQAYASQFGLAAASGSISLEQALRRATRYIDTTFRARFVGIRKNGRAQALEWPRTGAIATLEAIGDIPGYVVGYYGTPAYTAIADNVVPLEVVNATIEAAFSQMGRPVSVTPEADAVGALKRTTVGDVVTEFYQPTVAELSAATDALTTLDEILAGVLNRGRPYTSRAARG
jgi:hypothetical protein